ncbi:MATE family efflux transporter [Ulvibacterium marinum]|uniref:Lipopolysaccharide biosynthesis protein n=1 Tax=Ulvibacterium marinum TaxID=2419782 RepID=A0A3B0BX28_9FLAO|nr:hypothetical protein [Ulvibacterium marinum]RKN76948.1 hypothetical protein D7Z94_24535 [Ulvibacterium marinum]
MQKSHRIIFNASITYLRFFITIFLSFYTTRITLEVLGVEDFGLYSVIGGIVAMIAFFNTALAQATQRFLSYCIGSGDLNEIRKVFANSIIIHLGLALFLLILLETAGVYYVNNILNVEDDRMRAANILLQLAILASMFNIVSVPYMALLYAKENMFFIAQMDLLIAILRLLIVLGLLYFGDQINMDILVAYGFFVMLAFLFNRIILQIYVRKKYPEYKGVGVLKGFDRRRLLEQALFAGWNLLSVLGSFVRNNGIALVLNSFMGTKINASYSIGNQISNQAQFFTNSLFQALSPQIIGSEGKSNRESMIRLGLLGTKYGALVICLCSIPAIFLMDDLLSIWLKEIPQYTNIMASTLLVCVVLNEFTRGLETMVYAIGKIKNYTIFLSLIKILAIPLSIIVFKLNMGSPIYFVLIILILIEVLTFLFRIVYVKNKNVISFKDYMSIVILKTLFPVGMYILSFFVMSFLISGFITKLVASLVNIIIFLVMVYHFSMEEKDRNGLKKLKSVIFEKIKMKFN